MTDPSCAERIADQLASRIQGIAALIQKSNTDGIEADEAFEEMQEMPLSAERIVTWKILLSTGGPGDWFEYQVDSDGSVGRIEYHFQDWFDHASRSLDGEEYDTAETFGRAVTGDFYSE